MRFDGIVTGCEWLLLCTYNVTIFPGFWTVIKWFQRRKSFCYDYGADPWWLGDVWCIILAVHRLPTQDWVIPVSTNLEFYERFIKSSGCKQRMAGQGAHEQKASWQIPCQAQTSPHPHDCCETLGPWWGGLGWCCGNGFGSGWRYNFWSRAMKHRISLSDLTRWPLLDGLCRVHSSENSLSQNQAMFWWKSMAFIKTCYWWGLGEK